ncbi:TcfC E-set like domain-containing protein [Vibrio metoecus]|uniref:TcfC E-set like domain-containing protein n=1 Tax=Vibrio metoecus TaxID=1481663 RepID=UPI0013EF96BE|nr:TcfC E-set like domain-containing protein [Vibrio metoecus]
MSIFLSLYGYSLGAQSSEYPLEFADFFEQHLENVEVVVEGLPRSERLSASVSYDVFQLPKGAQSSEELEAFLLKQRLTSAAAVAIVAQLEQGVTANPGCELELSRCIPEDLPGQAEFIFDYDAKLLRIFVSTDMFEPFFGEREYYSPLTAKGALVNWSNLYAYASQDSNSVVWTNEALLGLPVGYLSVNSQYHSTASESAFDLRRAIYDYELDDLRFIVGYQDSNGVRLNSTDFLSAGDDYSGWGATLGSSANLLKGELTAQQRLNFFVPQSGQLEVYQGEKLLLARVVDSGEQSVGYDELPSGVYTVTLRLKQGSAVVFEERRQVVNNSSFTLPVGAWDYRVDIGRFDDDEDTLALLDEKSHPVEYRYYMRTLASYRPAESWLLGGGVVSNGVDAQWLLGSRFMLSERIGMEYTAGLFGSGDVYQFGRLNVAPFSFSVRQVAHEDVRNPEGLARELYGADDFTEYGASVSGSWGIGRTYFNYYKRDSENRLTQSSSDNVSLTWSHRLWGGDLSVSASLSRADGELSHSAGLSWHRRFGTDLHTNVGTSVTEGDQVYSYADIGYMHHGDDWSGTSLVGVRHYTNSDAVATGSVSLTGDNGVVRYDAYGYVASDGGRSVSGNVSGTQMLSLSGGALTSGRGQAYIELSPTWDSEKGALPEADVRYTALRNGRSWLDEQVSVGQDRLMNLPAYTNVEFMLDTDSQNIDTDVQSSEFFVMPGTYYQFNNVIAPLDSQVFVLMDMNDDPVRYARCIGDGCKGIEPLSDDGVFRVNYRSELPFKIVSDKRLCVYNPADIDKRFTTAYCLPGLEDADGQLVRHDDAPDIAQVKGGEPLIYIGKYESNEEIKGILVRLDEVGLVSKSIEVGAVRYVYVQYQTAYSVAQRSLLESLDAYVTHDSINTKQLFTSRFEHEENS